MFSTDKPDPKKPGRIKRIYKHEDAMTPLDKLASLPDVHTLLREGTTLEHLQALALALTDVQAAEELNEARQALFRRVHAQGRKRARPVRHCEALSASRQEAINPTTRAPIHLPDLQRFDPLRVARFRPLQAHT